MKTLDIEDLAYPSLLKAIFDPAKLLYLSGDPKILQGPCVAIVGTRRCTPYGEATAFALAKHLAQRGVCVVSGLAFGIDAAAHRGALAGGGVTAAVVAQPLDDISPIKHRSLAEEIVRKGGVVLSEKASGMETFKVDFLIRNRIIAGLCPITVVVEAGFPSGALNTATHAAGMNRSVYAVPGRLTDPMSAGCLDLIQNHKAAVLTHVDQIFLELEMQGQKNALPPLSALEQKLVELVRLDPCGVGELCDRCGASFGELYEALSELELKGVLWRAADARYALCAGVAEGLGAGAATTGVATGSAA